MATAPKAKPAKAAAKQKAPAQTAMGEADTSTPSLFQQAMWAARALWMGPPDGEPGKIGELEKETWACERSTEEAIRSADPTKKLSVLRQGVSELQEKLCASATKYYNKCFELALRNRTVLDATLPVVAAELGRTSHVSNPAEFARSWTTGDLSTFLRVTALDGKEKAQEIGSDGRVREFIRHVCGDYSDVLVVDPDAEQNKAFLLPRWPTGRTVGARMAQWWRPPANGDESSPLTLEETEHFILGAEEILIKNLRRAIAHAHRLALVDQAHVVITLPSEMGRSEAVLSSIGHSGSNTSSVSKQGRSIASLQNKTRGRPKSESARTRREVIQAASATGARGLRYCEELKRRRLPTPWEWQRRDGCPKEYPDAYKHQAKGKKWRQWISNEKSKATKQHSLEITSLAKS